MKIKRITAVLAVMLIVISAVSCNKNGELYNERNAYVSVRVYDAKNSLKISVDAVPVRVSAEAEELIPETSADGTVSAEAAKELYRKNPTGMYALELAVTNRDKNAALPTVLVSQEDGKFEYTLDTVVGLTAGRAAGSNDIYEWVMTIMRPNEDGSRGETFVADPFNTPIKTHDLIEFRYTEKKDRDFNATFSVTSGALTYVEEASFDCFGNKDEMTISKFLQSKYITNEGQESQKTVAEELGLMLSEDGKRIVGYNELAEDDTHKWVCLIDEEEIEGDISEVMIDEYSVIFFDYKDTESDDEEAQVTDAGDADVTDAEETEE